MLDRKSLKKKY